MSKMRTSGYALALGVFALDQLVKWIMLGPLALREVGQIGLLSIFNFTYVENHGVSLGMLTADSQTERWALVGVTAAIATGVAVWMSREKNRWDIVALGLVLGGALGNIVDRAVRLRGRFPRPPLRRIPPVHGVQRRRCGDHLRGRAATCPLAAFARQARQTCW